jgi:serine/threonine protein kinase
LGTAREAGVSEREREVERIALSALEVESASRGRFVDRACAGDRAMRCEVEAWLEAHADASGFLETPALALDGAPTGDASALSGAADLGSVHIEGFRLLKELGRGGMGVVYMAEQVRPRRIVALKVMRPDFVAGSALRRFELEAEVLARLHHPGIAHVYEVGVRAAGSRRAPFFAME